MRRGEWLLVGGTVTAALVTGACSVGITDPSGTVPRGPAMVAPASVAGPRADLAAGIPVALLAMRSAVRDPSSAETDRPRPRKSPLVPLADPKPTASATPEPPPTSRIGLPARSGHGRRVVYSLSRQRAWIVGPLGRVARTYLVSGQDFQPAPGGYRVYSKSRYANSAVSADTMEFMVRFARGMYTGAPIGFHSIPIGYDGRPVQTLAQLGEPLSAGCIRQRRADALALWRFATLGTRVVVTH